MAVLAIPFTQLVMSKGSREVCALGQFNMYPIQVTYYNEFFHIISGEI